VPEEPFVYPYLTGREFLQLTGRLRGIDERVLNEKIDAMLDLLSLHEHRYSPIASYSKGMKQKVLITAALLGDPQLLIFDEPLSGLDVTTALVFRNLMRALAARGKAILYSSHVLEVVEKVCMRVVILRRGQVVAHDSVERLRALMSSPSLEDVFAQLVVQEDTEKIAADMAAVMRG
jgi:ABC-2 type transport system ATP-binding protein